MDASILNGFTTIQSALNVISLLQLTAYRYPQAATVTDGAVYDYIIIGAGSAGCVMANRLTEDPNVSVLLVEAGGDPGVESNLPMLMSYNFRNRMDWNYTTADPACVYNCHVDNIDRLTRGKALGGSSSTNLLYYVRGSPNDFDTWARITNDKTWSYKNILPYFIKSERLESPEVLNSSTGCFHGTKGPLGVTKLNRAEAKQHLYAFEELGYKVVLDTNGIDPFGFTEVQLTVADGIRQSTANNYLSYAKDRPNLYVMKNSLATKINFYKNIAKSVDVLIKEGITLKLNARKEIIVAAGAINSPQLLMLSGIGPKEHLTSLGIKVIKNLSVGENLMDHKIIMVPITLGPAPIPKPGNPHEFPFPAINGFVALNISQPYPDYQCSTFIVDYLTMANICITTFMFHRDICEDFYKGGVGKLISLNNMALLHPKSRGRILLKNRDPTVHPLIYTNSFDDIEDLQNTIKYLQDISRLTDTSYFKSMGAKFLYLKKCANLGVRSEEYWTCHARCLATTMWHYSGTCAMGAAGTRSVVDSRLRVRGVKRLRVVDASIMPTITSGNTNAPTIMIAEKAADMVKEDNFI